MAPETVNIRVGPLRFVGVRHRLRRAITRDSLGCSWCLVRWVESTSYRLGIAESEGLVAQDATLCWILTCDFLRGHWSYGKTVTKDLLKLLDDIIADIKEEVTDSRRPIGGGKGGGGNRRFQKVVPARSSFVQ